MRRTIIDSFATFLLLPFSLSLSAQDQTVELLNKYGTFDSWSYRAVKESGIIGGDTKYLCEFYGDRDTVFTQEPYSAPEGYLWRTNNVMAVVAGITKVSTTVFPEKRNDGYCARIETRTAKVKAIGIINLEVTCQGALITGSLNEPIRDTKNPTAKVIYGLPFTGRPRALRFDYKADVGHEVIKGTGFAKLKGMGYPDYPEIAILLQKRWEDNDGQIHAQRVGTGVMRITENAPEWINGYRLRVHYGDITSQPFYEDYMGLNNDPEKAFHAINSQGKDVTVIEDGWAHPMDTPNTLIIKFLSSCGIPFYGGVGNTLWIDNVTLEMP